MATTTVTGNSAGTANSKFVVKLVVNTDPVYTTSGFKLKYKVQVWVTEGNFQNTNLTLGYSGSTIVINSGPKMVHESSERETSTFAYGKNGTITTSAYYTGGSGTKYTSTVTFTTSTPPGTMKVYKGEWKNAIPYVYYNGKWNQALPMVYYSSAWRTPF